MKEKTKRVNAVLKELNTIYHELTGQNYQTGIIVNENSEFNKILEAFHTLLHNVRQSQQARNRKQAQLKNKSSPQLIGINFQIRQDITKLENILTEGLRRYKDQGLKQQQIQARQKRIKNCYELLKDVKQIQQGGTYQPPQYPTLQQIKKKLIGREHMYRTSERQSINMEEQAAFEQFDTNDKQIDVVLERIIGGNQRIQTKLKTGKQKIIQGHQKIKKNIKKVQEVHENVTKYHQDLQTVLTNYRSPNQCCLNVTLIFMILALVGVSINLIRQSIF